MRKPYVIAWLFAILLGFPSGTYAQSGSCSEPTAGLVGCWPFNGNADDESGNGNHGTVNGAMPATDRFDNENCAFRFDGLDDYISVPNDISLVHASISVAAWANFDQIRRIDLVDFFDQDLSPNYGYELGIADQQDLKSFFFFGAEQSGVQAFALTKSVEDLLIQNWYFFVGTYDQATGKLKLYVDGVSVSEVVLLTDDQGVVNHDLIIGSNTAMGFLMDGLIDDVRIYDRALTGDEVEALFVEDKVIPVGDQLAAIEEKVNALVEAGILSNGEGTSLVNKLINAFAQLEKGKPDQAIKKIEDFIDQINQLIVQNKLTTSEGQPLIDAANGAIAAIEGGATSKRATAQGQAEVPASYWLHQSYPNPFNPSTEIRFQLPDAAEVRLIVYDVTGREVARLVDGAMPAGQHRARWDASGLPSGLYLYRLTAGAFIDTKAMTLLK